MGIVFIKSSTSVSLSILSRLLRKLKARFGTLNGSDSSTNKSDFCYKSVLINPVYNHSKILGNLEPTEIEGVQE